MRLENGEVLLRWPLAQHIITAGWTYNDGSAHNAIDLRAAVGTPVYAAEDGTVDQRQVWDGYTINRHAKLRQHAAHPPRRLQRPHAADTVRPPVQDLRGQGRARRGGAAHRLQWRNRQRAGRAPAF